jgi:hypothetical protein
LIDLKDLEINISEIIVSKDSEGNSIIEKEMEMPFWKYLGQEKHAMNFYEYDNKCKNEIQSIGQSCN